MDMRMGAISMDQVTGPKALGNVGVVFLKAVDCDDAGYCLNRSNSLAAATPTRCSSPLRRAGRPATTLLPGQVDVPLNPIGADFFMIATGYQPRRTGCLS